MNEEEDYKYYVAVVQIPVRSMYALSYEAAENGERGRYKSECISYREERETFAVLSAITAINKLANN